jgi:signal transduction histidine kinase
VVSIEDDGVGMADVQRRSGLANLRTRAEARGGTLELLAGPGTRLCWRVPRR